MPRCTRLPTHVFGKRRSLRGFTLIELLVTLGIVAVLAAMVVPIAQIASQRQKEAELRWALREIRGGLDAYKRASDGGRIDRKAGATGYPPNLEILAEGVADKRSLKREKIYFLRRIPRDPFHTDSTTSASETWQQRSYASEPDAPEPGDDVYDVYTSSVVTGLNGVPLRDW
ncbi:type II secretion system protein [Comamonas testosteroni]|uniref:type II secretion system protein n=1 Tax=Comamonas testosteroni TaxID=285 RepID=UPI0006A5C7FF|nr:type II secretion system protein [Comamonas testosteroni]